MMMMEEVKSAPQPVIKMNGYLSFEIVFHKDPGDKCHDDKRQDEKHPGDKRPSRKCQLHFSKFEQSSPKA